MTRQQDSKSPMERLRREALKTGYPDWRRRASCLVLGLISTVSVATFAWLFVTEPGLRCHDSVLYLSLFWLGTQWVLVWFLWWERALPAIARQAIHLAILLGNIWFIQVVFLLDACT